MRGATLRLTGKIYQSCVQSVLVFGSETWAMSWMCGVTLRDRKRTAELVNCLVVVCIEWSAFDDLQWMVRM